MIPHLAAIEELLAVCPSAALKYGSANAFRVIANQIFNANLDDRGAPYFTASEIEYLAAKDYRLIAAELYRRKYVNSRHGSDLGGASFVENRQIETSNRVEFEGKSDHEGQLQIFDEEYEEEIFAFFESSGGHPGRCIEQQFDSPGRSAVHRDGVVKAWRMPFGTSVISKRENRRKPGSLALEINNLRETIQRFGADKKLSFNISASAKFTIEMPLFTFVDSENNCRYAVLRARDGVSLEDILFEDDGDAVVRRNHLQNYRLCLDALFDRGIIWRDMSPRNIITAVSGSYHLVDFEKAIFSPNSLTHQQRLEACRLQFCVEELGVICPMSEVSDTFHGIFQPSSWDFSSNDKPTFKVREEICAVAKAQGRWPLTLGEFNCLDFEFMRIRSPQTDRASNLIVRPGLVGFKVEHYLSLSANVDSHEYDRMVTEIFLAQTLEEDFFLAFHFLMDQVLRLETSIVASEFAGILKEGHGDSFLFPMREARLLCDAIDGLYKSIFTGADLAEFIDQSGG